MVQLLRPDGNVTTSGITGSYTAIDEVTASDSDFAYGAPGGGNVFEVSLSNPASAPPAGSNSHTLRARLSIRDGNSVATVTNANPLTLAVFNGGSQVYSTNITATNAFVTYSFTFAASIGSYNDLRIRVSDTSHGGKPADRRNLAISWAELEVPDGGGGSGGFITSSDTVSVNENAQLAHTLTANQAVVWNIDTNPSLGYDPSEFEIINFNTLAWAGNGTQDYEDPQDTIPTDNVYKVRIIATNGQALQDYQTITVTVLDVDESGGGPFKYKGAATLLSDIYKGTRTEGQLYLGAGDLI